MARVTQIYLGTEDGLVGYCMGAGAPVRVMHLLRGERLAAVAALDVVTLLVASADGALQSFDGGATWIVSQEGPQRPDAAHAVTTRGLAPLTYPRLRGATAFVRLGGRKPALLGAGAGGMQLFRSEDDGIHWEPARIVAEQPGRVMGLAPDPLRAHVAWAGTDSGALLRTADAGTSWCVVAREPAGILSLVAVAAQDSQEDV